MRPFKAILKDLEESGHMTPIAEKVSKDTKRSYGVKDGAFSKKKWSSKSK